MEPYIITTGANGRCVIYGYCEAEPRCGQPLTIHRAKMIVYWASDCGGLLGLAANGPKGASRLTAAVDSTGVSDVREWVRVSAEAAALVDQWPAL